MTILFDLDNTLIDRNTAYQYWLTSVFEECGIAMSTSAWQEVIAKDNWGYTSRVEFYNWLLSIYEIPYSNTQLIQKGAEEIHQYIPPISKDVESVLNGLKNNYQIGIVTNGGVENQMNKLISSQLISFFEREAIFISSEMQLSKPDPMFFRRTEQVLQRSAQDIVIVGDDPINDIHGGRQAGWKTIWLSGGRTTLVNADVTLSQLTDLMDVL